MMPATWTSEDEELWTRYAVAALAGREALSLAAHRKRDLVGAAAADADRMLALHRERFPLPPKEGPYR